MPDGTPAGVRAWVFACGDCKTASEKFVAYLTTTSSATVDGNRAKVSGPQTPPQVIRTPEGTKWMPVNSPEAIKIYDAAAAKCVDSGETLTECNPLGKQAR